MKNLLTIILACVLLTGILTAGITTTNALSEDTILSSDGDYTYRIINENGDIKITKYYGDCRGPEAVLEIPSTIDGHIVTSLGGGFLELDNYKEIDSPAKVIIPNTVTRIEDYAFFRYDDYFIYHTVWDDEGRGICYLEEIVIPDSVTYIGDYAFSGCRPLNTIKIPNTVEYIGKYAFYNTSIVELKIPKSVTYLGERAFDSCHELTKLVVSGNIEYLGEKAFRGCYRLNEVKIKYGIKEIPAKAFEQAGDYVELKIPKSIEKIGNKAFYRTRKKFKIVTLSENVEFVGKKQFGYCKPKLFSDKTILNKKFKIRCLENSLRNLNNDPINYAIDTGLKSEYILKANNRKKIKSPIGYSTKLKVKNKEVVNWASTKPTVATINKNGKLTTKSKGKTILTATLENGKKYKRILKVS